jgi:cardiolipin synthase A/B
MAFEVRPRGNRPQDASRPGPHSAGQATLHRVKVIGEMAEFIDTVLGEMARARNRILIGCFIVRGDKLGRLLGDALAAGAARGLDVRLLYDPRGSSNTPPAFFDELRGRGVDARSYGEIGPLLALRPQPRNHARIVVVDGVAYTGGQAWGDEWLPRERGGLGWHDVCCRVEGPVVEDFAQLFEARWREAAAGGRPLVQLDTGDRYPDVRLVSNTPLQTSLVFDTYIQAFARARSRIWIANAYCFPPKRMLRALSAAARRGVDVRLILPAESDMPIIRRAARGEYDEWLQSGIKVWEYQHSVMHAKYAVVDEDWCSVGTLNANASVSLTIEIAVIGLHPEIVRRASSQIEQDFASSVCVTEEDLRRRPLVDRLLDGVSYGLMAFADAALDGPIVGP